MATSSAPGKVILFGEHAVVYNRPALAVPVTQVHADVEVRDSARAGIWIEAPEIDLHAEVQSLPSGHPLVTVINDVILPLGISPFPNLEIKISSTIPVASGLGSGAAVTVALARALSSFLFHPMTDEEVNSLAYEIEKFHHGTPSGIDNTVVTYAKPVYFIKGHPIETVRVGKPFTIVIADTGLPAPTKESVGDVRRLWLKNTNHFENMFDEIAQISLMARRAIESGKPESLGELMNQNHGLLQEMTVSCSELDKLVEAARRAGALGAKLSGGGRGGNMIALVNDDQAGAISAALMEAGAGRVIVTQVA
jgi:mevalonate kinase